MHFMNSLAFHVAEVILFIMTIFVGHFIDSKRLRATSYVF